MGSDCQTAGSKCLADLNLLWAGICHPSGSPAKPILCNHALQLTTSTTRFVRTRQSLCDFCFFFAETPVLVVGNWLSCQRWSANAISFCYNFSVLGVETILFTAVSIFPLLLALLYYFLLKVVIKKCFLFLRKFVKGTLRNSPTFFITLAWL